MNVRPYCAPLLGKIDLERCFFVGMAALFEHVKGFCHRYAKFAAHNNVCPPMFRGIFNNFHVVCCSLWEPRSNKLNICLGRKHVPFFHIHENRWLNLASLSWNKGNPGHVRGGGCCNIAIVQLSFRRQNSWKNLARCYVSEKKRHQLISTHYSKS